MVSLTNYYKSINPKQICFFAFSNVGEYGYQFLISPERVALGAIKSRLVSNDAAHHSQPGHTYCRVFCPTLGQMCWTLSIVTSTGESLGRKGIVYCFGAVFDAALFRYRGSLLPLLYSFSVQVHQRVGLGQDMARVVDHLAGLLNHPDDAKAASEASDILTRICVLILLVEAQLKGPRWSDYVSAWLSSTVGFIFRKGDTKVVISAEGALSGEDRLTIFNREASRLIGRLLPRRGALTTSREFSSDTLIEFVEVPGLNRGKPVVDSRFAPSGTQYVEVRFTPEDHPEATSTPTNPTNGLPEGSEPEADLSIADDVVPGPPAAGEVVGPGTTAPVIEGPSQVRDVQVEIMSDALCSVGADDLAKCSISHVADDADSVTSTPTEGLLGREVEAQDLITGHGLSDNPTAAEAPSPDWKEK
jgi:hypothetical protein